MSINPDSTNSLYPLRSIVYHNAGTINREPLQRKRNKLFLEHRSSLMQSPLQPSKKKSSVVHISQLESQNNIEDKPNVQNQFLPGAALLSCFILICHLLILEKKEYLFFQTKTLMHYPSYNKCNDKYTCELDTVHYNVSETNVTHFFVGILVLVGYGPTHIIYFVSEQSQHFYKQWKNLIVTSFFATLLSIIHGQHDLLLQILSFMSTMICLVCGTSLANIDEAFPGIVKKKWILVLFYLLLYGLSLMPTVSAYKNGIEIPWFVYVSDIVWFFIWQNHIYALFYISKYNIQLILQLVLCLVLTIAFWEYGRVYNV